MKTTKSTTRAKIAIAIAIAIAFALDAEAISLVDAQNLSSNTITLSWVTNQTASLPPGTRATWWLSETNIVVNGTNSITVDGTTTITCLDSGTTADNARSPMEQFVWGFATAVVLCITIAGVQTLLRAARATIGESA